MKGKNLGRAMTIIRTCANEWAQDDEFGAAMGAPMGELRPLINRCRVRQLRNLKRHVRSITGLKWNEFQREVTRRTSGKWVYYHSRLAEIELSTGYW